MKTIYRCPECGDKDNIEITGVATARMRTNQIGEEVGYELGTNVLEFTDGDNAACTACGHSATVGDFTMEETMEPVKPTPEGWRVEGRGDKFAILDHFDTLVAEVPFTAGLGVEPLATVQGQRAMMMAAAPELLDALEAVVVYEDDAPTPGTRGAEVYAQVAKAIKKARGEF